MSSTPRPHNIGATSASCMVVVALVFDFINLIVLGIVLGAILGLYGATFMACTEGRWFTCAIGAIGSGVTSVAATGAVLMFGPLLSALIHAAALFVSVPVFWAWFYFGHHYNTLGMERKKLVSNITTAFVELIPLISILPGITLNVIRHIMLARTEDRERARQVHTRAQLPEASRYARTPRYA